MANAGGEQPEAKTVVSGSDNLDAKTTSAAAASA